MTFKKSEELITIALSQKRSTYRTGEINILESFAILDEI